MMAMLLPQWTSRVAPLVFLLGACLAHPGQWSGWQIGVVHVKSGDSIQAAIDSAKPGQLIVVGAGTYTEQLTISTNGVHLVGRGAVLMPPSIPVQNTCSGLAGPDTEAGFCITGSGIVLADFVVEHRKVISVGTPVVDVLVSGFEVHGFSGLDIAVVGGQDVVVTENTLYDGAQYGCLTVGSIGTRVDKNTIISTADLLFIGLCMDDLSDVRVTNNHIDNYVVGLCVQTNSAYVAGNDVSNTCYGAFVDPGVDGAQLVNNHIRNGNPVCLTFPEGAINGILLDGASRTNVEGNLIEGMRASGSPNATGVGVVVVDDAATGAIASGNAVIDNVFQNNDFDIYVQTNGTGNVIQGNQCSLPVELCG